MGQDTSTQPGTGADVHTWQAWVGRAEIREDRAAAAPLAGLAGLLDHDISPWRAGELPPLAHWLYFLPRERQSMLDIDGHPKRGDFLPPVPLPRRMWVGGRLRFLAPIPIDAAMVRRSTITHVTAKQGRAGPMVFVTVRHEVSVGGGIAIVEDQDIVYRAHAPQIPAAATSPAAATGTQPATMPMTTPGTTPSAGRGESLSAGPVPRLSQRTRTVVPDPTQLFRFSALTFNAHRIHYDRDYARGVEGYPGLVVHGPWIATLLLDHLLRKPNGAAHGAVVSAFDFRAERPLFDTMPFDLCLAARDGGAELWASGPDGTAMTASAGFDRP